MTDQIKPKIIAGVGLCNAWCPQFYMFHKAHLCKIKSINYDMEGQVCPVYARRVAAERDSYRSALIELRLRLHVTGRRPEECHEMSIIDDVLRIEEVTL